MESAVMKNGVLYCPYCNAELQRLAYSDDTFWFCNEESCFGNEEDLLWNSEGNLLNA